MADWQLAIAVIGVFLGILTLSWNISLRLSAKLDVISDKLDTRTNALSEKMDAKLDMLAERFEAKTSQMSQNINSHKQVADARIDTVRAEEGKARHDTANAIQRTIAEVVGELKNYVRREDVEKTEIRVGVALDRIGSKLDETQRIMSTLYTVGLSMDALAKRLDKIEKAP